MPESPGGTPVILVIEHQRTCPPGWVGDWLTSAGCRLEVRRPYPAHGEAGVREAGVREAGVREAGVREAGVREAGDALPGDLTAYAGFVVLGGSMSAGDDASVPWLTGVKSLVREAAHAGVPTLGICLGHQLAAVALGGTVAPSPRGKTTGVQTVDWLPAAREDPLVGPLTSAVTRALQWNNDLVTVMPVGTKALAHSHHGELLAARFAPTVWGVQWHPEAGVDIVRAWAAKDEHWARERGVDLDATLAALGDAEGTLRHTWKSFTVRFAKLCRAHATERGVGT